MEFCSFNKKYIESIYEIEKNVFTDYYSLSLLDCVCKDCLYRYSVVLADNNSVIAYAIVYEVVGEAEIHRVAVDPNFRMRGLGEAVLNKCIENLKNDNIKSLHLEVRKSNYIANCLYKKLGFELVGVRKGYYADNNDDALLYTLQLVGR